MYTPFCSKHFTTHVDPVSGMEFAVLSSHVAPVQQGFYFINSGWSDDGRYLWFYCAFPPSSGHSLGVIDFLTDEIRHFPETKENSETALVDRRTGNLYWGCAQGVYMRTPHIQDKPVLIAELPEDVRKAGVTRVGTHLTFTPDGKELLADIQTDIGSVIGSFDIAEGKFVEWYRTTKDIPYNHAQMNPVDNNICMCAHEHHFDPNLGKMVPPEMVDGIYPRMQIINRDGGRTMLKPYGNSATHEWWAPDGKSVFYCTSDHNVDGSDTGVIARNWLDGREPEVICKVAVRGGNGTWHAHCTKDEKYFVIDGSLPSMGLSWWRGCESTIHFYNKETKKMLRFLTKNPVVEGFTPRRPSSYHIDPHPRFVLNDTMITFTTTVCGRVDLAVISVEKLIKATS